MTTSRWLPLLVSSYFRQQVESVSIVSPSEKLTPSKSSQFFLSTVRKNSVSLSPVGFGYLYHYVYHFLLYMILAKMQTISITAVSKDTLS